MADERRETGGAPGSFDREIGVRGIVLFLIGLTVAVTVIVALMYALYRDFQRREEARDAPPSPLVDRSVRRLPPEPRLQAAPERELEAMRAVDGRILATYGWVDPERAVARVPIERAMDMILERGLPARAEPPAGVPRFDAPPPRLEIERPRAEVEHGAP